MSRNFYVDTHVNFTRENKIEAVGSLSNDDDDGNENGKNAIGLACATPFCAFLCRHCTTTTWNVLRFTFFEGRGHKKTTVGAAQIQFLNDFFVAVAVVLA